MNLLSAFETLLITGGNYFDNKSEFKISSWTQECYDLFQLENILATTLYKSAIRDHVLNQKLTQHEILIEYYKELNRYNKVNC